jgi:hypothetical protein
LGGKLLSEQSIIRNLNNDQQEINTNTKINMKKSITGTLALLAGALVAHGQGTVVFGNYGNISTYLTVNYKGVLLGGSGQTVAPTAANYGTAAVEADGDAWTVQLYGGATSGAITPLAGYYTSGSTTVPVATVTANLADGTVDGTPGTWYSATSGIVPGATSSGFVQVYAWYSGSGVTSYSVAVADGLPAGYSAIAATALGGAGSPPATPPYLPEGLGNITLTTTPEPSTIALGVIGASAFLMRLRRKQ